MSDVHKMERVLQVIGGMNRAGAETMLMNIYRTIDHSKVQFDFVVYKSEQQDYEDEIEALGGRVFRVTTSNPLKMTLEIRRILKTKGPYAAVHAHTLLNIAFAMLATLGMRVVRVAHSHSTQSSVSESLVYRMYKTITKWIIRAFAQRWLACGEPAGVYLFGKKFLKRGKIINNSVDAQGFADVDMQKVDDIRKQYDLDDKLVIGNIGRLEEVKNHAWQIEIAKALKTQGVAFKMLFIGRGPLESHLRETIKQNSLENYILLLGVRSDIPELLRTMDVFLMPSHFEGNPVTLIEAQAAGTPCVIADHISDEIDIEIGLCKKCSLEMPVAVWTDLILKSKKNRISDYVKIHNALVKRNYDLEMNSCVLLKEYGLLN